MTRATILTGALGVLLCTCSCDSAEPQPALKTAAGSGGDAIPNGPDTGGKNEGGSAAGGTGGGGTSAGGASAGSSGAAQGNGGEPPRIVADCDGLGAVDEWQRITPPDIDPTREVGVVSVLADPAASGHFYVGTSKQGLWKTTDCGASWSKLNTGTQAADVDSGTLWELHIDRTEPNVLYTGSQYGSDLSLLKSTTGGVDWKSTHPPGSNVAKAVETNFFQGMSLDPTNPSHLVLTFHANCTGEFAPACMAESLDKGETWRLFKAPTDGWLEAAGPLVFGPKEWLVHTVQEGVWYTADGGATWKKLDISGTFSQGYRAKDGYLYMPSLNGMFRSRAGDAWEKVDGGPQSAAIIGDGKRMFTTWSTDWANPNAERTFYFASEDEPTKWSRMAAPPETKGSRGNFAYDEAHHVLLAAMRNDGVWRMVTQ